MAMHLSPPGCEPLHINDVRQHIKQDITDDDNLIALYLGAARAFAEDVCTKQLVSAKLAVMLTGFSCRIRLKRGPVVGIAAVNYRDSSGNWQTIPADQYQLDASQAIAVLEPASGYSWPATDDKKGSVEIAYYAGYIAQAAFNAAANSISLKNWQPLLVDDVIRISNSGGSLPSGLHEKTDYFIKSIVSPGVYTLSATLGGNEIDLTDAGLGFNFAAQPGINFSQAELPYTIKAWLLLRCETHYAHRGENVNTRGGEITPLPYVDRLLDNDRIW